MLEDHFSSCSAYVFVSVHLDGIGLMLGELTSFQNRSLTWWFKGGGFRERGFNLFVQLWVASCGLDPTNVLLYPAHF